MMAVGTVVAVLKMDTVRIMTSWIYAPWSHLHMLNIGRWVAYRDGRPVHFSFFFTEDPKKAKAENKKGRFWRPFIPFKH
ncbi:hypothetical protein [Dryocola sp. BD613]|uniref:hypothetical protein n=1 Tax=Dryocola sp. BD613 TaxID=3133272 RepID=UPI003F4FC031